MKQKLSKNKYLYKRLKFEEIKNPQYFFDLCTKSKLLKLLIRIFFNRENFIKLFDVRIIGSLILRDLNASQTNKSSILNIFLLLLLSIFIYRSTSKNIIEKKYLNLVKIVYGHIHYYEYKKEKISEIFLKKNLSIFPHYSFSSLDLQDLKKKNHLKNNLINKKNLEKKLYIKPVPDQMHFLDSQWWKFWIVEQILPNWKLSSNSINKIKILLEKKNIEDLKHFFEFYIDNMTGQNYNWENKFNSIFFKDFEIKKEIEFKSDRHVKILEDTLILQIFSAFCEKLIFEIEDPFKRKKLNSLIELSNNKKFFSFIIPLPFSYKKKVTFESSYLLKKKIFNIFKNWNESDEIIAKSYVFMKKKGWFFFHNYVEFYIWQLYKNYFFYFKKDLQQLNIIENKLNIKNYQLNYLNNEQKVIKIQKRLSNIPYKISKYILYKIKKYNKLKKITDKSIYNYEIINKKIESEEINKLKKTLVYLKLKTNFLKYNNKFFFEWFSSKIYLNNRYFKHLNITSIIWDIPFFIKDKKKIELNLFSKLFFENYKTFWIKNLFTKNKSYIRKNFIISNKIFSNFNSHPFSNIVSIDELNMAFCITNKYLRIKKDKRQKNSLFENFIKSDTNRLVYLWKIKKNCQNINCFIYLDYAYKIIQEKKYDINKFILANLNSSSNILSLVLYFFYKYNNNIFNINKNVIFQFRNYINYVKGLDKINSLIIKSYVIFNKTDNYNTVNYNTINYQIDTKFKEYFRIKKIDIKFYKRNKIRNKIFIENYSEKKIKISTKFFIKFIDWYKLNLKFYLKILNNLFLLKNFSFVKRNINLIRNKNIKKITKNIINQTLLNYKKTRKNYYYYNNIKKKYIDWNLNLYKWADQQKKWKKISEIFIVQHKCLTISSNKKKIFSNKNSIIRWSKKLKKKDIYIFHKTFIIVFFENFNKIFKKFEIFLIFYPNLIIIQNNFLKKIVFDKNNLLKQKYFNVYNKLIPPLYLNKISIIKFMIHYLFNKENDQILKKKFNNTLFSSIWENQEFYSSSLNICSKNSLNLNFSKANTLKLLNFLNYFSLGYKKKLLFSLEKNKNNNRIYKQLLKNLPVKKKHLFINELKFVFYKNRNIDSIIKSKMSRVFLFNNFKNINDQKLIFIINSKSNKLLDSLIQINLFFSEKKNFFFNISSTNELIINQNLKFEIFNYEKKKKLDLFIKNLLKLNNNFNQTNFFQNYILSEFFLRSKNRNNERHKSIKNFFIKYDPKINLIYTIPNKPINKKLNYEKTKKIVPFLSKNSIKLTKIHKIFQTSSFFIKWILFKKYISWFFTFEWWKYFQNIYLKYFSEIFLNFNHQFSYILPNTLKDIEQNLYNLSIKLLLNLKNHFFDNSFKIWNYRLLKQINNQQRNQESKCSSVTSRLINIWNNQYIAILSLITFGYLIFQKYFSTLLGSNYFELWKYFEIIQYLMDPSRGIYLDNLIHHNSIQFIKSENLLMHFFKNLKHYIKNINFYLFTKQKVNKWLSNNKGLDLSRRERKILVQSLITDKSINQYGLNLTSNKSFINSNFDYSNVKQQKLNYLEYLTENYQKNLVNYPFRQFYLTEKLIFLSFWQKITSSQKLWQVNNSKVIFHKQPAPLELILSSSKGILLIGSLETGRSYLIKNIAAKSFVPLMRISVNKLLYNKPDILTESWMNILMESLRRLSLILELAEKLSPCIIWIQNIHELNVNRLTQNVESDPTFLLGILLKYFQTSFIKKDAKSIVIIGSTHLPKRVDPALISPNRLDRLINIRIFNILQRQTKISILLHNKYFYSKKRKYSLNEIGNRSMGYNTKDLAGLINEILLINITQNQLVIHENAVRLAFHRQALGFTYINKKQNFTQNNGTVFYKVGKVIIQNLFIKNFSKNPLYLGNDLWKKKFYYLSKWYLEPTTIESTIKEFTILPHILGCLAGLAARDSWFIVEKKSENLISLDKYIENDFYLACGILESLLKEFSWLEIFEKNNTNRNFKLTYQCKIKDSLHMIKKRLFLVVNENKRNKLSNKSKSLKKNIYYKKKLYQLISNITWVPKIYRINFIRSNLFNWTKRPNDYKISYNLDFLGGREKKKFTGSQENINFCEIIEHKTKEQLPCERILYRIIHRNVQELESQVEDILLEEQFANSGSSAARIS
uniref:Protein Ycf2 n=1 Tax=Pogonatum inflexum TaxID=185755 RepID=A0A5J6XK06_9BRYO|nr:Ycf2 [Pogonatum inflexum]